MRPPAEPSPLQGRQVVFCRSQPPGEEGEACQLSEGRRERHQARWCAANVPDNYNVKRQTEAPADGGPRLDMYHCLQRSVKMRPTSQSLLFPQLSCRQGPFPSPHLLRKDQRAGYQFTARTTIAITKLGILPPIKSPRCFSRVSCIPISALAMPLSPCQSRNLGAEAAVSPSISGI